MAIHPNGTIDPCKQTVGDPCFACGTVDMLNKERFDVYVYLRRIYTQFFEADSNFLIFEMLFINKNVNYACYADYTENNKKYA